MGTQSCPLRFNLSGRWAGAALDPLGRARVARRRRRVHFEGGECHDGFRGGQKPRLKVTPAFGEESLQKAAASARRGTEEPCLRAAHGAPRPRQPVRLAWTSLSACRPRAVVGRGPPHAPRVSGCLAVTLSDPS